MNELTSLGMILLLALFAGHIVRRFHIPEVTGYILIGIAFGPSALGWITSDNLSALAAISEVALGLILFSIGTVFEYTRFRKISAHLARIVSVEAFITATIVATGLALSGQSWQVSLLVGAMSIETAAATTLMVIREYNAQGSLTELLTGLLALDNLLCLIVFSCVMAAIQMTAQSGATAFALFFPLVWQLFGSAALGYVLGFLLSGVSPRVVEHRERLILLVGCIVLGVGIANAFDLSPMVTNLAVGATVANLSDHSKRLFRSLSQTDPPLYAIFFVVAGARLDPRLLKSIGLAGAIYLLGRFLGKFGGVSLGGRMSGLALPLRNNLRFAVFAQAGLAVGLTTVLTKRLPHIAPTVNAIVLSAVIVFEIIGPLAVRWTLMRSGEAQSVRAPSQSPLD